ncbi:MAG: GNAT family N-acetyltransferase [Myxococcota bacterium]
MAARTPLTLGRASPSFRFPTFDDAARIGLLVSSGLSDAPSAPIERDELGADLEQVGRDFVSAHLFGNETVLLADLGRHTAGLARLVPREFVRAAHVGTLQILVAPNHRHQGVGRALLAAALADGFGRRRFERIEMAVAANDLALLRLTQAPQWTLERLEHQSLCVYGDYVDVGIWVTERP